ncbi:hypothetical protein EDB92DRAFT_1857377 [Lactarius akahatsu]|uniref:DUF6697 domain-containing protein n=1 Tax=Lactarius akahatsu TaxID=416441 RepID=A0AAD4LHC6_9AGAM|nr:hypothetical protein EDB92DRAFT_1857377 [Lactarius akahatsu]
MTDIAPDRQILDLRCRMLEIERDCAAWRSEEYRKLLEQFSGGVSHVAAAAVAAEPELEDRQQPVASSSRSAPATPSRPASRRRQPRPSLAARRGDDGREQQQRTLTPQLEPPEVVRRGDPENGGVFAGIITALCADNSPRNRAAIFSAAEIGDYQLASREADCARQTPEIPWKTFTRVFGGWLYSERPMGRRLPGYDKGNFLCAGNVEQPFAPKHIGEPGVILFSPGKVLLEDTRERFHVLVDSSVGETKANLQYCGVYTKVRTPYMEVQIDEWYKLATQVSKISTSMSRPLSHSDIAQCRHKLLLQLQRSKLCSDPPPAEIWEWIKKHNQGSEAMEYKALQDAFDSGTEKLGFEVIRCVGYDTHLAGLIQKEANRRTYLQWRV